MFDGAGVRMFGRLVCTLASRYFGLVPIWWFAPILRMPLNTRLYYPNGTVTDCLSDCLPDRLPDYWVTYHPCYRFVFFTTFVNPS